MWILWLIILPLNFVQKWHVTLSGWRLEPGACFKTFLSILFPSAQSPATFKVVAAPSAWVCKWYKKQRSLLTCNGYVAWVKTLLFKATKILELFATYSITESTLTNTTRLQTIDDTKQRLDFGLIAANRLPHGYHQCGEREDTRGSGTERKVGEGDREKERWGREWEGAQNFQEITPFTLKKHHQGTMTTEIVSVYSAH